MIGLATTAAVVIDRAVGEPPASVHPVARFGSAMTALERRMHAPSIVAGVAYSAIGVGVACAVAEALRRATGPVVACATAGSLSIAGRMLDDEVRSVAAALKRSDRDAARRQIARLVGRSTGEMGDGEIARAAIETIAENSVDAVTASVFWGVCGGAHAVLIHRAVNTMDAMVGHRTERHRAFGVASARLDDTLNWVPARLTVLAVAVCVPRRSGEVWRAVRRDAHQHPSPNGGVIEAAFAAALGVRLGGVNRYGDTVEDRGTLGHGREPTGHDVDRAVVLSRRVQAVFVVGALVAEAALHRALRGRSRCAH
ncbi:MAG: adenosylcobinamide-phosphate synthase CbiB [Ilumatobacter sp.]